MVEHFKPMAEFKRLAAAGLAGTPVEMRARYRSLIMSFVELLNQVPRALDSGLDAALLSGSVDGRNSSLQERIIEIIDLFIAVRTIELLLAERAELAKRLIQYRKDNPKYSENPPLMSAAGTLNSCDRLRIYMKYFMKAACGRDKETGTPLMSIAFPQLVVEDKGYTTKVTMGFEASGTIIDPNSLPKPFNGDVIQGNKYKFFLPSNHSPWNDYYMFHRPAQDDAVFDQVGGVTVDLDKLVINRAVEKDYFGDHKQVTVFSTNGQGLGVAVNRNEKSLLAQVVAQTLVQSGDDPTFPFETSTSFRFSDNATYELRFGLALGPVDLNGEQISPVEAVSNLYVFHVAASTLPQVMQPTVSDTCFSVLQHAENLASGIRLMALKDAVLSAVAMPKSPEDVSAFIQSEIASWYPAP